MKTTKQILAQKFKTKADLIDESAHMKVSSAIEAMKEYAKQEAAEFSKWLNKNRWFDYDSDRDVWNQTLQHPQVTSPERYHKHHVKTTDELYQMFWDENIKT